MNRVNETTSGLSKADEALAAYERRRAAAGGPKVKNTGGPAFPSEWAPADGQFSQGMTLRDYAAIRALQGFCANPAVFAPNPMSGWGLVNISEELLSKYAYDLADAMLRAREA